MAWGALMGIRQSIYGKRREVAACHQARESVMAGNQRGGCKTVMLRTNRD